MRPLTAAAIGLTVLVVDFRTRALDLAADPIGFGLLGWCAWKLEGSWILRAATVVGTMASAATVYVPYHYEKVEAA